MAAEHFPVRPMADGEQLKQFYIGRDIANVPKPAVVLDVNIIKRNCTTMLQAMKALNVGFRAHVKTHKTSQLARLQVGEESEEAKFVTSTVLEIETLVPLLKEFRSRGRKINVLYGLPLVPSQVPRLATIASDLGEDSICVMIDHPDQLSYLSRFSASTGFPACVYLKVDAGYRRAGLPPKMLNKQGLLEKLTEAEKSGHARLIGLYSHSSLSYTGSSPDEALSHLTGEIMACKDALQYNKHLLPAERRLTISLGASPQVVAVQNLLTNKPLTKEAKALKVLLSDFGRNNFDANIQVELHAGVYPILDMQQLATKARPQTDVVENEVAISVVAEVCSTYNEGERDRPEALVALGTLGLGREPCQANLGWASIGSWRREPSMNRLVVDRISQEHSIIAWADKKEKADIPVKVGQAIRIFPNHACVTGAMYGWYLVVDSSEDKEASKIVDVWTRPSGW